MTETPPLRRHWIRPLIIAIVTLTAIALGSVWLINTMVSSNPNGEEVSAEERARNDDSLRDQPSLQAAAANLEQTLDSISAALSTAFPYLQFTWSDEGHSTRCTHHDEAYSWRSANLVASAPISEDDWDRAYQIVVDQAAALGAIERGDAFHNEPGMRDTFTGAGGYSIRFGHVKTTVISGITPCRLPESALRQAP